MYGNCEQKNLHAVNQMYEQMKQQLNNVNDMCAAAHFILIFLYESNDLVNKIEGP